MVKWKRLHLDPGDKLLVDDDEVRFIKIPPLLTLDVRMTSSNVEIHPGNVLTYYEQQFLDMQKAGELPKGVYTVNAYLVVNRTPIDETETIERSWGPTPYRYVEKITTEFYFLGV